MMKLLSLFAFSSFFAGKALIILLFIDYMLSFFIDSILNYEMLLVIYGLMMSGSIALSYLSEWRYAAVLMMKLNGKVDISGNEKTRVEKILSGLMIVAQEQGISKLALSDIMVLIDENDCCNAWAYGNNVIVLSRAALSLDDDMLKGLLAHELGHLINRDGKYMQMLAGEFLPWLFKLPVIAINNIFAYIGQIPFILFSILSMVVIVPVFVLRFILAICDDVFNFVLNIAKRKSELAADRVAVAIGAKSGLKKVLCFFKAQEQRHYFWSISRYFGSHPQLAKRIELL